jgi:hypothetical protein
MYGQDGDNAHAELYASYRSRDIFRVIESRRKMGRINKGQEGCI